MSAVLVINCGSSSVKFSCIHTTSGRVLASGNADKLHSADAMVSVSIGSDTQHVIMPGATPASALRQVFEILEAQQLLPQIIAVGHRVVHGGEAFKTSTIITPQVHAAIERCSAFAPLHNPSNLAGINLMNELVPQLPQIAVFDTAFHQSIPEAAFLYAVPMEWYRAYGVRRYGFHGTSHRYVSEQTATLLNIPLHQSAFVSAHLGNGASAAAILNGKSVDTTMGFTPLEGLVMGTRSGDIDPGLTPYLAQCLGIPMAEVVDLLNKKSGLLGLSELSNDMRTLEKAAAEGHVGAAMAIEVFVFRLARAIGALAISLPKLDALIFTGGIGENSPNIRAKVLKRLGILGFMVDEEKNQSMVCHQSGIITAKNSTTAVVMNTNEELMIALETITVMNKVTELI